MRTVFIGAVEGSALALLSLCDDGQEPDLVVTLPLEKSASHSDFVDLGPTARIRRSISAAGRVQSMRPSSGRRRAQMLACV